MKFKFPDTGEGVTEGQFLEWKVDEGDSVEEDQIVGEAETDKAVVDIPSPTDGTVESLEVKPGDTVEVGETIMYLKTADSEISEESENHKEDVENSSEPEINSSKPTDSADQSLENNKHNNDILALPKVRKLAEKKDVDLGSLDIDGRIKKQDVLEAAEKTITRQDNNNDDGSKGVNARPSVRILARKHDLEISMIEGTGRNGEITRDDVLRAAGEKESRKKDTDTKSLEEKNIQEDNTIDNPRVRVEDDIERIEMSSVRKITADKMVESRFSAPHVTHIEKVDITRLVELRESIKSDVDTHLTYLPFIIKACIAGLKEQPHLNSELDEENNEIIKKGFYDFNIAVDTERGLLVPKVEDVDRKNMAELAVEISGKAEKAQNGDLDPEEMSPGTFSITNLGVIGGEAFTPIIYPPQSAILGVGKIQDTAEVVDGEVVPRKTVKLCLSYDHRVVDGGEAARFMNKVKEDLENPKKLIIDM